MKNLKKLLFIIVCLCVIAILTFIVVTYSKYRTSANGSANVSIARWDIKINNQSIKNSSDISNTITPVFPGTNDISANVIAPTAEGYFDLNLDYTNTDVSFDYTITVKSDDSSSVPDLVPTGYSLDENYNVKYSISNNKISGSVLNTDTSRTKKIRVYIKWDDENGTMNNAADTNATVPDNAKALLNVNVQFIQKVNTSSNP